MSNQQLDNAWLADILYAINSDISTEALFRKFAHDICKELKINVFRVYFYDLNGNLSLRKYYDPEHDSHENGTDIDLALVGPVTDCAENEQILVLSSKKAISGQYPELKLNHWINKSIICIPLKSKGVVEGVLFNSFDLELESIDFDSEKYIPILNVLGELCHLLVRQLNKFESIIAESIPGHDQINGNAHHENTSLSERQLELLCMLAKGLTNGQIALRTNYSEATVRVELGKLFAKLNVANRQEAASIAHLFCNDNLVSN